VLRQPDYLLGGGVLEPGDVLGFFGWLDCPAVPPEPAEPLELPVAELPLVPPLAALFWSRSQPDNSVPASAIAKTTESACFIIGVAPFRPQRSNKRADVATPPSKTCRKRRAGSQLLSRETLNARIAR
jgi:hypothetical protein